MPYRADAASIRWIADSQSLAAAVAEWGGLIGLDTEFVRTDTFYPEPGIYQIAHAHGVDVLDPLSITDFTPFADVLKDPQVTKIMHACQEDAELIHHHLGVVLAGVFDTQFAQAFVSEDFSLSYARLVEQRLDIALSKHETRSNWRQRPLTDQQIEYAVEDVVYLHALYDALHAQLQTQGKLAWFDEEMTVRATYLAADPQVYYKNLKKAWGFRPAELARLKALCAWREMRAQSDNIPRNRVVWDDHLFRFARRAQLRGRDILQLLPKGVAQRYLEEILQAVADLNEDDVDPIPQPLTSRQGATVKTMRDAGLKLSSSQGMAPELLCRKRDLEELVRHHAMTGELSACFATWRKSLVGETYLAILNGAA